MKLKVGDRVLIKDGSSSYRDLIFKSVPMKVRVVKIFKGGDGFDAIYDENDKSKVKVTKWSKHPFWYHLDEIIRKVPEEKKEFNPSLRKMV